MTDQVLVLNATYEPINVCTLKRAVVLVLKEKAEVIERAARHLRTATGRHAFPLVIRLVYYVKVPRHTSRKISRRALFARDNFRCQYCGATSDLTMDHVVPRSRGGGSDWGNVVTCCSTCNLRKGNRLPDEVGMTLRRAPVPPGPDVFIAASTGRPPAHWQPYLREA